MARLRRLLQRFIKPAAMVGVVGTLSLSLIVTTPSNAYAFKTPMPVTPTFVMGAVKTVAPVAMAAVSVTPIGWGLRIFQLAMLAYETQDMWMPYVTGLFGNPDANGGPQGAGSQYARPIAGVKLSAINATGTGYTYTITNASGGTKDWFATQFIQCKTTSTGVVGSISTFRVGQHTLNGGVYSNGWNCGTGQTMVGAAVMGDCMAPSPINGTSCTSASTPSAGPENIATWGTLVPNTGFNPRSNDIGYVGKSECIDSAGTKSWVTGPEVPGDNGAMLMPSCEKAGKGHGTGRTTVTAFKPDGTQTTVWDTGAQPLSDPATPLCDPGRTSSGCIMEIYKDDQPCKSGDVECENWGEESAKDSTRWKCKFGPYTLPLSSCNLLEKAYQPGGAPLNDENTDGNPQTSSNLGPDGQPAPSTAPGTGTGTGTGTGPVPGGAATGPPAGATQEQAECFPTGWAMLNPVEWVMKPVGCALDAAFKPKKDLQTRISAMQGQFSNKVPMSWFGVGTTEAISGGGCPTNWAIDVSGNHVSLICGTPAEGIIQTFRPIMGAMLVIAALWPLIRSLFYAAIPVFRVTPS